jgi:Protein of unknown function (DUF2970)
MGQEPLAGKSRPARRKAGMLQVAAAVFWSFLGVRKSKDREADAANISPVQVIVMGIIGAGVFVTCLILIVRWVTR